MKMFYNVIVVFMFVCYFFGIAIAINDINKNTNTNVAPSTEPCVLQDAVMHDGTWFLYDKPTVFDTEACEVMAAIFRDEINVPIAAIAECVDGCYLIHLN